MVWVDAVNLEQELSKAIETFNWSLADSICNRIIERINREASLFPDDIAKKLSKKSRKKRQFHSMALLAEALIHSGHQSSEIRRQYEQGLIDQGIMTAPRLALQSIIQNFQGEKSEEVEARDL